MSKSFYNTINLSSEKLQKAEARALGQEELIKEIFRNNPHRLFSPSQIQKLFISKYDRHNPITSIRRGMTNLASDKHKKILVKTDNMVVGEYGLPEHTWRLNVEQTDDQFWEELQSEQPPPIPTQSKSLKQTSLF